MREIEKNREKASEISKVRSENERKTTGRHIDRGNETGSVREDKTGRDIALMAGGRHKRQREQTEPHNCFLSSNRPCGILCI